MCSHFCTLILPKEEWKWCSSWYFPVWFHMASRSRMTPFPFTPETTWHGNIKGEAATSNSYSSHRTHRFFLFFFRPNTRYLWVETCEKSDSWLCPDLICSHVLAGFLRPVCYLQEGFDSLCWMDWAKTDRDIGARLLNSACLGCFFFYQF